MAKKRRSTGACVAKSVRMRKMGKRGKRCTCITSKGLWKTLKTSRCK